MPILDSSGNPALSGQNMSEQLSAALRPLVEKYAAENHVRELVVLLLVSAVKSSKELGMSREQIYSLTRQAFDGGQLGAPKILQ